MLQFKLRKSAPQNVINCYNLQKFRSTEKLLVDYIVQVVWDDLVVFFSDYLLEKLNESQIKWQVEKSKNWNSSKYTLKRKSRFRKKQFLWDHTYINVTRKCHNNNGFFVSFVRSLVCIKRKYRENTSALSLRLILTSVK